MTGARIPRVGAAAAFIAAGLLATQFVLALPLGSEIALLYSSVAPASATQFLAQNAQLVTLLFALDDGFAIAYTLAFVALAYIVVKASRQLAVLGLGFIIATAALDWTENSITLAALELVEQGVSLDHSLLALLFVLGQLKFLASYPAVLFFGISIWKAERRARILAALLFVFPLVGLAAIVSSPFEVVRILWMLVMLVAGGIFLWKESGAE